MLKITMQIDGMICGMCESHVNAAIRRAAPVKKVTSRRGRGETVVLAEQDIDETSLRAAVEAAGYTVKSVSKEPCEERGLFHL